MAKKVKPIKRLTNSKFKKILTELAKQYAKHRDKFTCQRCWVKTSIHWSHIIPVSADGRLSINIENIKALCFHDHMNWRHKNPIESWIWAEKKRPARIKLLRKLHKEHSWKWSINIGRYREQAQAMIDRFEAVKIKPQYKKKINSLLNKLKKDLSNNPL